VGVVAYRTKTKRDASTDPRIRGYPVDPWTHPRTHLHLQQLGLFSLAGRRFSAFPGPEAEAPEPRKMDDEELEERLFHLVDAKISPDPVFENAFKNSQTPIVIDNGL